MAKELDGKTNRSGITGEIKTHMDFDIYHKSTFALHEESKDQEQKAEPEIEQAGPEL